VSTTETVLEVVMGGGFLTFLGDAMAGRAKVRRLKAEASHLETEDIKIVSATAVQLLKPVKEALAETQQELAETRKQLKELSAELEHQRSVSNELTVKLEAANRRADYYQHAFDERAEK
jgi:septal ring factor EnvC (AmiA/AmiB activator)